ncbi:MAG TPA: hypothetical protein VFS43_40505 [Polyangiaceae bacterium]|nr:hypothetical protein [Polyangiaceae bacterium]
MPASTPPRLALALALALFSCRARSRPPPAGREGPPPAAPPEPAAMTNVLRARPDPALSARVLARRPLLYAAGPAAADDRPAHVRAGSALAWLGGRLAVVQDDANFVAFVRPFRGEVSPLTLPAGPGGLRQFDDVRGNKRHKLDLEASAVVPAKGGELLLAFGSGSTPARERVLVLGPTGDAPEARLVAAPALYQGLRANVAFAGSELNVEGALARGRSLWLFQRGNGAPAGELSPVNATCELDLDALLDYLDDPAARPAPSPQRVRAYDLGSYEGLALSFTDATELGGRALYVAVAEASPDATRDGPVSAVALGLLGPDEPRYTWLRDEAGRMLTDKVEGLAPDPEHARRLYAVVDRDEPGSPAELLHIEVAP